MIVSIRAFRKFRLLALPLATVALAAAGCGGDDEPADSVSTQAYTDMVPDTTATTETQAEDSTATDVDPETETLPDDGDGTGTGTGTGEGGTGGAGDEVPAQTLALFTAKDGKITPRRVQVPAFISIRVELRSGDGTEHSLTFGSKTIKAGGTLSSASTAFDGLRPGDKLVGTVDGGTGKVVVSATAEPGP